MGYVVLVGLIALGFWLAWQKVQAENHGRANPDPDGTPEQRHAHRDSQIVCPHCQERGHVRSQAIRRNQRLSLKKAGGAVATLGMSAPLTGLSKKQAVTQMSCTNCGVSWTVAG